MGRTPDVIEPDWRLAGVTALSTTRRGGCSAPPWDGCNLGEHVGDDPAAVAANRRELAAMLPPGTRIQWLHQVHGNRAVAAGAGACPAADACWSRQPGSACAVLTADCLPVLFAAADGSVVAAAHAGWRGLLAGVLEATVVAMDSDPLQIFAWMGPAIGPQAFEVGDEVRRAFLESGPVASAFAPGRRPGRFLADLYSLGRQRLHAAGLRHVSGGGHCTFADRGRFYSFRRDGRTGRMASLVCIDPH